jgi:hypothetical protein
MPDQELQARAVQLYNENVALQEENKRLRGELQKLKSDADDLASNKDLSLGERRTWKAFANVAHHALWREVPQAALSAAKPAETPPGDYPFNPETGADWPVAAKPAETAPPLSDVQELIDAADEVHFLTPEGAKRSGSGRCGCCLREGPVLECPDEKAYVCLECLTSKTRQQRMEQYRKNMEKPA